MSEGKFDDNASPKIPGKPEWFLTSVGFKGGKNIGLTEEEFNKMVDNHSSVLEVGTGTNGTMLKELLARGINIIGIEPGLNYVDSAFLFSVYKNDPELKQRVVGLTAVDAIDHPLMPHEGVDYVIAQGPNFAQYVHTRAEFIAQLIGLVRCLKHNQQSWLNFQLTKDNLISLDNEEKNYQLLKVDDFLNSLHAKFEMKALSENPEDDNLAKTNVIRIFRINNEGEDLLNQLLAILKSK